MFEKILDCPKCRKRFHYECDGALPPRIVCPECHAESPKEEFSAVVLCSACRSKLKLPLDMLDTPDVVCPKCGRKLVGETLNLYDEEGSTIALANTLTSGAKRRLLADGELFDKYRIVRLLGRGGMAEVYLAEHLLLQRPCALKLLRRELAEDAIFIRRFIREAKLANRIEHPNIVRVYDAGSDFNTGLLFLAMEYVEGRTLREVMREKLLSEAELREILIAMAGALKALAELHVIHRDIKPSNIMRTKEGVYKLMDLGIAKSEGDRGLGEMTLTLGQTAIGTPSYASPEQCRSAHNVDIRSDIYSLGATLYHLASGKVPFDGETPVAVILNVMEREAEPLRKLRPDLSPQMIELIARMMEKNPDDRPSSPEELLALATAPDRGRADDLVRRGRRFAVDFLRLPRLVPGKIVAAAALLAVMVLLAVSFSSVGKKAASSGEDGKPAAAQSAGRDAAVSAESVGQAAAPAVRPAARPAAKSVARSVARGAKTGVFPSTLEARIRHVTARLDALRRGDGGAESSTARKFREYRIKLREEQLKRLREQQKVRERALALKKKSGKYPETGKFREKFARYTKEKRDREYDDRDIRFADELIAMLKSGKVDPNVEVVDATCPEYSGPLIYSVLSGRIRRSREIVDLLLRLGADTTVPKSVHGWSPSFRDMTSDALQPLLSRGGFDAMRGFLIPYCSRRPFDENPVTELLYLDHNVEECDAEGNTALHHVAGAGSVNLVTMIVALDGDVDARNRNGDTPLVVAMRNGRTDAVQQLIALGADLSLRNQAGKVVADVEIQGRFRNALRSHSVSAAREALQRGAEVNMFGDDGETALHIACRQQDSAMAAMLLAAGADPNLRQRHDGRLTPLQMVVDRKNFNMEIAAMLLKHGADPNVPPSGADGPTLLYRLCAGSSLDETQQLQLLRVLLADPRTTLTDPGRDNRSLLSLALECRRSAAFAAGFAERLGQFGPKDPVLHYAVLGDYPESLLREVIAKKANVNAVENDKTPLWVAKEKGMDDVVKLLLAHGADPEWRNSKGASLRDVKPTAPVNRKLPAERGRESTR